MQTHEVGAMQLAMTSSETSAHRESSRCGPSQSSVYASTGRKVYGANG